jgi:hypothetical protein
MTAKKTIVVESPFEGGTPREADNVRYLQHCLADCFRRGEAPFASHGLYPGVLDDTNPEQRALGIESGWAIAMKLDAWVWYLDRGVTPGMLAGFDASLTRKVDLATLCATTLFRGFGQSMVHAMDLDPVEVMRTYPALARLTLHFPGLAAAWKIGQS